MSKRQQGIVKWVNGAKGYGYIERAEGEEVLVHFSSILADGFRNLEKGQRVEFTVIHSPKGLQATEVVVL